MFANKKINDDYKEYKYNVKQYALQSIYDSINKKKQKYVLHPFEKELILSLNKEKSYYTPNVFGLYVVSFLSITTITISIYYYIRR
jgi:hypothetical protein